jgi:imidazolonepropionase-like amidohydrolase
MHCYLFENARVFDGIHADLTEPLFVLVEGGEIRELSGRPINTNVAERIDCRGKTVMPGMIDCHVHIYAESVRLAIPEPPITYRAQYAQKFLRHVLSCGFTSVRDVAGGDHGMAMALRAGFLSGPRFFYGGLCLSQTGGHGDLRPMSQPTDYLSCGAEQNVLAVLADGVDACRKAAREELRKGASHIKIMGSGGVLSPTGSIDRCQYSEAEIRAIVEECARHGAYVCAHCHPTAAIRRCVEYGVRCIEHGTLIDESTAAFVASKGAFIVPTLSVVFALMDDGRQMGMSEDSHQKLSRVHEGALAGLDIMKRAGVKIGFGTDLLGDQHTRRGTEFEIRCRVMTPFEILHSATAVNAEILGMQGKLGVVQPGACADLLVVDGDPLIDLSLLAAGGSHLTHIMVEGRFVKQPGMNAVA